ncbi:MAG: hypothetical protein R6U04_02545 [Bacteroidales bacterium]
MNTIIKFFSIFIFLCGAFSTDVTAQRTDSIFSKADKYFSVQQYLKASIEYERLIYRNPDNPELVNSAHYKKSLCYRHTKRYQDALNELNRISLYNTTDTLKALIMYERAFNLLMQEKPKEALLNIKQIHLNSLPEKTSKNILPLKIMILNKDRKWEKAENTLTEWINALDISRKEKEKWIDTAKTLYAEKKLPKNYKEEKAKNLSRFIPGAGQIYTSHTWEGIASFFFNAAALGAGIHQVWYGYYFTGYIAGFGIFYKSYFGGMERAANLANTERNNEMAIFNSHCAMIISKILADSEQ